MTHKLDYLTAAAGEIVADLGAQLVAIRLAKNITQKQIADEAGLSLRTLGRLEKGKAVSLDTFVRVLIALKIQQALEHLLPDPSVRPVERAQGGGQERQRARGGAIPASFAPWTWKDDEPAAP
jgi:transcriptional regulator with XRE-family HTH domain